MPRQPREFASGLLLIAGSLAVMVVMALHPTAHDMMSAENHARQAHLGVVIHAFALAATPIVFLGLLGLARRLSPSDVATAALVAFGFGAASVLGAAVASGFVATPLIGRLVEAEGESGPILHELARATGLWNQGYAAVHVVAYSIGILPASAAILRTRRLSRATGVAGLIVGLGVLLAFFSGHLNLNVHGAGLVAFAQYGWLMWLGIVLCRSGERGVRPSGEPT